MEKINKKRIPIKEIIFFIIMSMIGLVFFALYFKTKNILFVLFPIIIILYYTRKYKYKTGFLILLILFLAGLIYYLGFEPLLRRRGS